jgi:hypothetical protein
MSAHVDSADPGQVGYSLANVAELVLECLAAVQAGSVVEVGAYRGGLTARVLDWAARSGAKVTAIDADPPPELEQLAASNPGLELVRAPSPEALEGLRRADAFIIDGDHNYFTVTRELDAIVRLAGDEPLPLLMFHDVGWPHARRDTYWDPERIPPAHRQPLAKDAFVRPEDPGVSGGGLPYEYAAAREGGAQNGVLSAVEDFAARRGDMELAVIPAFFGFGALWARSAPWASAIAAALGPYDRHPVLERLEANRAANVAARAAAEQELATARERLRRQEELLTGMLDSRAFAIAERLSSVKQRGEPVFSRERVLDALGRL